MREFAKPEKKTRFLRQFHEELSCNPKDRGMSRSAIRFDMSGPPARREKCVKPLPIEEIFEDMTAKATFDDGDDSDAPLFSPKGRVVARLSKLESEITRLARQIEQIQTFLKMRSK